MDHHRQGHLAFTRTSSSSTKTYEETEESARKRETAIAQLKLERTLEFDSSGRPSKKDRRAIARFTKRGW
jgi:hypothetical protein